jgi:hypothetical protein
MKCDDHQSRLSFGWTSGQSNVRSGDVLNVLLGSVDSPLVQSSNLQPYLKHPLR